MDTTYTTKNRDTCKSVFITCTFEQFIYTILKGKKPNYYIKYFSYNSA